jgi:hypothetical protein
MWPFSFKSKWSINESLVDDNMFFDLAGLRFHDLNDKQFTQLKVGDVLLAKYDPDNEYDSNAVALYAPKMIKIGHLPRVISARYLSQFKNSEHYVSISKLEKTISEQDGKIIDFVNIGVRFPILFGWAQPIIIIKPHGFLTNYKGYYYLYTDSQLTAEQNVILDKIVGVKTMESIGIILLEIEPDKFHDFKFKYKFPESAILGNIDKFIWKVNDEVGISLPLIAQDIEKSTREEDYAVFGELADNEDRLRKNIVQLQGQLSRSSVDSERLSIEMAGLQEEIAVLAINAAHKKSSNKEALALLAVFLPNIIFLHDSVKTILTFRNMAPVVELLSTINAGPLPNGEMLHVTKGQWFELKFATGDSTNKPAGRLYYHRMVYDKKIELLVGDKESQESDIKYLKKWEKG